MFLLSQETTFESHSLPWAEGVAQSPVFWQTMAHTQPPRLGLVIRAGCAATFQMQPSEGQFSGMITVGAALAEISPDGLEVIVTMYASGSETEIIRHHIQRFDPQEPWTELAFTVELHGTPGCLRVECGPGPSSDPTADWLALYEIAIAPQEELTLHRARAFREYRQTNELSVCTHAYADPLYGRVPEPEPTAANVTDLSNILLDRLIGRPAPDFAALLHRRLAIKAPLRILSLASGAARSESDFLRRVRPEIVDVTLTDINAELLEQARDVMLPHKVRTVIADVNEAKFPGTGYDIILCVSALHHVIELERVVAAIARSLAPGGEFWSVGEYIGRTGARLWPEAYQAANAYFRALPERCRFNRVFNRIDTDLPNFDCSVSSFESIRSEEIESILARHFTPDWVDKRACIIWRLFDPSYAANYDMKNPSDRALVKQAVELDIELHRNGGRPVSLNGVYLPTIGAVPATPAVLEPSN